MVVGTFRVSGRGLVAFGDLVYGRVRPGEGILIQLNSSTVLTAIVESVESVDRPSGSHVGLLLKAEDELKRDILEALNFAGETLEIAAIPQVAGFDEAVTRLRELLRTSGWPTELIWVPPSHVISFPGHVLILRQSPVRYSELAARSAFESASELCPAVRVGAIGNAGGTTYAAVWPIHEIGDGEQMFIDRGLKVNAPVGNPRISIIRFAPAWWLAEGLYKHWKRKRDVAIGTA